MSRFLLDSSCMVAVVCGWHEHHERAAREVERRLSDGAALVVAAPTLIETYAVLTRLPFPHRLAPADSLALLEANFMVGEVIVVALDADAYLQLLRKAPENAVAGGHVYDMVVLGCALSARVDTLLTFNERHFRSLGGHGISIVVPS